MSEVRAGVNSGPGKAATTMAIVLIVAFLGMLIVLATMRGDEHWDRLVFLLSGFEAIVFAGAGALFGTAVQRGTVSTARNDAENAKEEAKTERARADDLAADAVAGRVLKDAVISKAEAGESSTTRGGQESLPPQELDELSKLAQKLFRNTEAR